MIIRDFHFLGSNIGPPKHNPPLIVDANRVLASKVACQDFETITGWNGNVAEDTRIV